MKKLHFSVDINASREKVWQVLWNDKTYGEWTSAFSPGSYAVTDWKEGSKVQFLSPKKEGLFSLIEHKEENKRMTFKHLGEIKDGVEQPPVTQDSAWYGATEEYILEDIDGNVRLNVQMDAVAEYESYFAASFPKALENVKKIAEQQ